MIVEPRFSATIVRGVKTNRVRVRRRRRNAGLSAPATEKPPRPKRPARGRTANPVVRRGAGPRAMGPYRTLCISVYVAELTAIDAAADVRGRSRSAFLREAASHYIRHLASEQNR